MMLCWAAVAAGHDVTQDLCLGIVVHFALLVLCLVESSTQRAYLSQLHAWIPDLSPAIEAQLQLHTGGPLPCCPTVCESCAIHPSGEVCFEGCQLPPQIDFVEFQAAEFANLLRETQPLQRHFPNVVVYSLLQIQQQQVLKDARLLSTLKQAER